MSEQKCSQKSRRNTQDTALEDEKLDDLQGGASSGSNESGNGMENLQYKFQNNPVIKSSPVSQGQEEGMAPPGE